MSSTLHEAITRVTGEPAWRAYVELNGILGDLAVGADERLAWHSAQPAGDADRRELPGWR